MIKTFLGLLLVCLQLVSLAQTSPTPDEVILKIPQASTQTTAGIAAYIKESFATDSARLRAIYVWITHNINYDVALAKSIIAKTNAGPQPVDDVLKTRTAVCQGYAELFAQLCTGAGIKAAVISGYTKRGGMLDAIGHAWVAAATGGSWHLYDPTWGAGYVKGDAYVKAFNNKFYDVAPADMIKDHMPFDPMYQFLHYPVTNKEFVDGQVTLNTSKPYFNYADTLQRHESLSAEEKISSEVRRLTANGITNERVRERLQHLSKGFEFYASKNAFEDAGILFKEAITFFNKYIQLKNKQFAAVEDSDLQTIMEKIYNNAKQARSLLYTVTAKDDAQRQVLTANHQSLEKFQQRVKEEKDFLTRYLAADKAVRPQVLGRQ